MKTFLAITLLASMAHADFKFKYELEGTQLELVQTDQEWDSAFKKASQKCFDFYMKKKPYSEAYGLDVIDVCANPK